MRNESEVLLDKETEKIEKPGRRDFLKFAALTGVSAAVVGADFTQEAHAASILSKTHETIDDVYEIDPKTFKRFNAMNSMFMRGFMGDKGFEHITGVLMNNPISDKPGFTQIDKALFKAGGFVEMNFTGPVPQKFGFCDSGMYSWKQVLDKNKYKFESPEDAALIIKKTGKTLGACLVGIAPFDERWLYTHALKFIPKQKPPIQMKPMGETLPFKPKSVIMLAVEMDYEHSKLSPTYTGNVAATLGYSQMANTAPSLARFIQQLGYKAIPVGNDTFRNVPMAIAAGLGEASRMGLLVTEKYGPRIRLCAVATELELPFDKPITFGVKQFCRVCLKCADNCPSGAISTEKDPSFEGQHNRSNSVGIKKWHTNAEKCLTYWGKIGFGCMNCLCTCPYNKVDSWNHDLAKLATVIPGVRHIARSLDESFGYGKAFNEKAVKNYWKKG